MEQIADNQVSKFEEVLTLDCDLNKPPGERLSYKWVKLYDNKPIVEPDHEQYLTEYSRRSQNITKCAGGFLTGQCESGHSFARLMLCNKEWCPDCGKKNSYAHKQRVARWYDKVMKMESVGYLVVTIPEQLRNVFKNQKRLREFRTYFKRKLIREGYKRGLCRYHWAGDCEHCRGKENKGCLICENTGMKQEFAPHLNFLIEGKFIEPSDLERWRNDLADYFNKNFNYILKGEKVSGNLHYNYGTTKNYRIHKLKYVTRATWRHNDYYKHSEILKLLKGFRTSMSWGKFEKTKEQQSEVIKLMSNKCPCCDKSIQWGGFESIEKYLYQQIDLKKIDAGFFQVKQFYEPDY